MVLTDIQARNASPKKKSYKLFDNEGLYLYILTSGKKVWRFKYRYNGKEGPITIDKYSSLGLKEARAARNKFNSMLADGVNPAQAKKRRKNPKGKTLKKSL